VLLDTSPLSTFSESFNPGQLEIVDDEYDDEDEGVDR
jgi:hypothetical protein